MSVEVDRRPAVPGEVICASEDLPPGAMVRGTVGSFPVLVVRTPEGELHGLHDKCIHQGARVSGGRLQTATDGHAVGDYHLVKGQSIVKCPWHGYEYDVRTGCVLFDPRRRLRKVRVAEVDGQVIASA